MHERQGNGGAPLSIFISYVHKDEPLRQQLEAHLSLLRRQGLVASWHDRQIIPGTHWAQEIDEHLETAAIILLLVSPDFLASDYCYEIEMQHALARHQRGEARVLPIILRPCDWTTAPFAHLQALPHEGKAVTSWTNQDEAFLEIVRRLRQVIGPRPVHPSSTLDQQNRTRFLEKVSLRSKDLLDQSLRGMTPIALRLRTQPAAVLNMMQLRLRQGAGPEQDVPVDTTVVQLYDQVGGELLLLGAPGAGKTTLLLELACALQQRAQQEREHPIAVIVNLSTWANTRQPLEEWLVEEIVRSYEVPRRAIAQLVQQDQLLPLLDGLDEVPEQARAACIAAINHFQHTHWLPLVVCSRQQEYTAQSRRFTLRSAVLLQPLTEDQVDNYFKAVGKPLAGIRSVLHKNEELRELVSTPLMLHVLTLAYWGVSVQALPKKGTMKEQQRQIFDQYVRRMLERQEDTSLFPPQRTIHWLSWLAKQIRSHNQTVFHLEHVQPDWLPLTGRLYQVYEALAVRLSGVLIGALVGLLINAAFYGTSDPPSFMIWSGLIGGLVGGLISGSPFTAFRITTIVRTWKRRWRQLYLLSVSNGLLIGVATGGMFTIDESLSSRLVYGISTGLCGFLLSGLIEAGKVATPSSISPHAQSQRWWSRLLIQGLQADHLRLGILVGLLLGLSYGLSYGLSFGLRLALSYGLSFRLSLALREGLRAGMSVGLSGGIIGIVLSLLLLGKRSTVELAEIIAWSVKHLRQSLFGKHHLSTMLRILLLVCLFLGLSDVLSYGLGSGLFGLSSGLSSGLPELSYGLNSGLSLALREGLSTGMSISLVYWILLGLWNGFSREMLDDRHRTKPNQGVRRSVHNGIIIGLFAGSLCGIMGLLKDILFYGLSYGLSSRLSYGLSDGLVMGIAGALLAAFLVGGLACLRHLLLRVLLAYANLLPWRTIRFLDDAARRILLYKDGGGYRFIHRLLLDYFASINAEV